MDKIKIIQVTQSAGGVETYLRQVLQNIDHDKFEIIMVSCQQSIEQLSAEFNLKFYHVKMSRGFNLLLDIQTLFALRKIFNKEKPALVHLHTAKAGFLGRMAARALNYKSLFSPHGGSYMSFKGFKRRIFLLFEKIGKRSTYKMLAVSQSEANRFMNDVGIPQKKIYIIPNGISIPVNNAEILNSLKGEIKVGTIGRLTYQKNPLFFVEIANEVIKRNPSVHFYFLGAGTHDHLKDEVISRIKEYNITGASSSFR